jgi:uncharacterized membrane protein YczE
MGNALSIISDTGSGVWTAASINLSQATQLPIKWILFFTGIPDLSFTIRVFVSIFGIIVTCIGTSIYQRANIMMYPTDNLTNLVRQRFTKNNIVLAQRIVFIIPISIVVASAYFNHHIYGVQIVTIFSFIINGAIIGLSDKYIFPTLIHNTKIQISCKYKNAADV